MIRKENLEATLKAIGYIQSTRTNVFEKKYAQFDCTIEVDFNGNGSHSQRTSLFLSVLLD